MPTQSVTGSAAGAPINITGLASGLNTNEIINALMAVERRPVAQLTNQQSALQAQQTQLKRDRAGARGAGERRGARWHPSRPVPV